jgi:flagellin-like hook-associated protein FlgL
MASNITLSAGVRQNLLSLQNTATMMGTTQNRLATGKKVNSALDNPTNFFTSASLQGRASDMGALLDAMSNGIKTLEAADNGLSSITKTVESMQSTLRQARQDKSFKSDSYTVNLGTPATTQNLEFTGGSVGTTPVAVDLTTAQGRLTGGVDATAWDFTETTDSVSFSLSLNGSATLTNVVIAKGTAADSLEITVGSTSVDNITVGDDTAVTKAEIASALTSTFATANVGISVAVVGNAFEFTATAAGAGNGSTASIAMTNLAIDTSGATGDITAAQVGFTVGGVGVSAGGTQSVTAITAKTVDTLVNEINANTSLVDRIRASNDNGKLRVENLSTADLTVTGVDSATSVVNGGATADTIGGNDVRKNLVKQFNELRDQLNKLADDASFNGVNLLRGDKLKITFNETGTSTMEIQAKDADGNATSINAPNLNIASAVDADFDSDTTIDTRLSTLQDSLNTLRSQSSSFGSNLSIVQNRQDFTKNMINTLQTGADNLVLADSNEEGANLLALQTRQQLSTTALSLSAQADQAVLRLF